MKTPKCILVNFYGTLCIFIESAKERKLSYGKRLNEDFAHYALIYFDNIIEQEVKENVLNSLKVKLGILQDKAENWNPLEKKEALQELIQRHIDFTVAKQKEQLLDPYKNISPEVILKARANKQAYANLEFVLVEALEETNKISI